MSTTHIYIFRLALHVLDIGQVSVGHGCQHILLLSQIYTNVEINAPMSKKNSCNYDEYEVLFH